MLLSNLTVQGNQLYIDNEPFQLISGAIHYYRVIPEYWEDRLIKLKACGFNTVETYVPWNLHEPREGEFNFTGIADLEQFIETAADIGLYVIIRPSPYICSEWEFGGLPSWLLADRNMRIRSYDEPFLEKVDQYYDELLPRLVPYLSTNGGPIIAMQIENEYGSFGNDNRYLRYLRDGMIFRGIDVLLFTSDGPRDLMLQGGTLEGILPTVNFGSRPTEAFQILQSNFPGCPNIVMEFWNGWFDHWGEEHHTRDHKDVAKTFEQIISKGDSINFYMFHGGTNFGFYNGANFGDKYEPTITSYDYDAPISESGDLTPKYYAIRDVLQKQLNSELIEPPVPISKVNYGPVEVTEHASIFNALSILSEPIQRSNPETMEVLGQDYGFILYRTTIKGSHETGKLSINDVRDRALVFLDKQFIGIIDRWENQTLEIAIESEEATLDILVENMGRINYGPRIYDYKGITQGVRFDFQFLFDWEIYRLPLSSLTKEDLPTEKYIAEYPKKQQNIPTFYHGTFTVDNIGDTFVHLPGWKKGVVFINGFNLGRYWEVGPQKTLYLPGPLLREGTNEIMIFELHEKGDKVELIDKHLLDNSKI